MTIWFTADTHFGHRKIPYYAKRKFCLSDEENYLLESKTQNWKPSWYSIKKMDEVLIDNINKYVKENDELWHLGDFCFIKSKDIKSKVSSYIERIFCKNISLIWGNHDHHSIASLFKSCHERREFTFKNKFLVLSHYAQAVWNKSHNKSWHLYGHSHGTAENWLDTHMPGRLSLDVGVDNINKIFGEYRPVSFEELCIYFKNKKGLSIDKN
jgi:calcineurin-like phosphoesterase family protein